MVEAGDGFEESVEVGDVFEEFGVIDEFISAEIFVFDGLIGEVLAESLESEVAAFDEGEDLVFGRIVKVVEEFGNATEATEPGVAGAGTVRKDAAFEDKDFEVRGF